MRVLGALALALGRGMEVDRAVTISFLTLAFAQLWHVFNMRDDESSSWRNEITRNPHVWGALALCTGLLLFAVYGPVLPEVLELRDPGPDGWIMVLGLSLAPLITGQLGLEVLKRVRGSRDSEPEAVTR